MRIAVVFLPDELPVEQEPSLNVLIADAATLVLAGPSGLTQLYKVEKNDLDPSAVGKIAEPVGAVTRALRARLAGEV